MSIFKHDLKVALTTGVSMESETLLATQPITQQDVDDVATLRDESDIAPITVMTASEEINEANQIRVSIVGAIDQVRAAAQLSPALLAPAVATANETVQDTAKLLGVAPPSPLELDADTLELSEPSMEGVLDWLSRALAAFGKALVKLKDRIVLGFHRFGNMSVALKRRVAKSYSLLPRRKNEEGGKYIKLKNKWAERLVLNEGFAIDPCTEITHLGEFVSNATLAYVPALNAIHTDLSTTLASLLAYNGHWSGAVLDIDVSESTKVLAAIEKEGRLFLGNVVPKLVASRLVLPTITLVPTKPSPEFIVRTSGGVMSLSSDAIRSQLLIIQKEIDMRVEGLEAIISDFDDKMSNIVSAITRIQYADNYQPVQLGDSKVINALNVASKVGKLFNAADLNKLEARVYQEYGGMADVIQSLFDVYFDRIDAVLALVEESLMQD